MRKDHATLNVITNDSDSEGKARAKLTRRSLLMSVAAAAGVSALSGCAARKPFACQVSVPHPASFPELTIDTHCHIFNGTDLQVEQFIKRVVVQEKGIEGDLAGIVADLLQDAAWSMAPNGHDELGILDEMKGCGEADIAARAAQHREQGYLRARKALRGTAKFRAFLQRAKSGTPQPLSTPGQTVTEDSVFSEINQRLGGNSYAEYQNFRRARVQQIQSLTENRAANRGVGGVLDYIIQNFQYRYVTSQDYVETFNSTDHGVDLMLASMVDYDWWLAGGLATKTPLEVQMQVMEQISILTRGRVHAMAPYDPMRDVAFSLKQTKRSSLDFVQEAVLKRGAVGVKLYPPMGFAPLGNSKQSKGFWKATGVPDSLSSLTDLGARLDAALEKFYGWCEQNEVPVMAHSRRSNGPGPQFQDLAGPEYWALALECCPRLRVSFGHFGDFSDALTTPQKAPDAQTFIDLMSKVDSHAFADTGFFSEVLTDNNELYNRFEAFYKSASGLLLTERLMYGTDWDLLLNAGVVNQYFDQFVAMFKRLDGAVSVPGPATLSRRFFGYNALDWAGLRTGGAARQRLDDFYRINGIGTNGPKPDWMEKADNVPVTVT